MAPQRAGADVVGLYGEHSDLDGQGYVEQERDRRADDHVPVACQGRAQARRLPGGYGGHSGDSGSGTRLRTLYVLRGRRGSRYLGYST